MVTTVSKKLDAAIVTNDEVGYHQNWYPIALSSEIDNGKVKGVDFLGSRVVTYRDNTGKAAVLSAYCRHLGADLSEGELVDGCVRCPYHHWQYDTQGKCVKIPSGDKIPPGAKLFSYPSAEAFGLVWAFNGEEPLYDLPRFHDVDESALIYDVREFDDLPVEPWLPISNSFDLQHLKTLHGLTMSEPFNVDIREYGFDYDIEAEGPGLPGRVQQHIRVAGTNTFMLTMAMGPTTLYAMTSFRQLPGHSINYLISAVRRPPIETEETRQMVNQMIQMNIAFAKQLTNDDRRVLSTIHFREGLLVESDRLLAGYFKYIRGFPRANPAFEYR